MKQKFTLLILSLLMTSATMRSQEIQEIATGAGYQQQSFFRLADGVQDQSPNGAWDIAFSVFGFQDGGIFINEGGGSSMGQPQPIIELYDAFTVNFSETPDTAVFLDYPLYNDEASWANGAFNAVRDPQNQFDFGWGAYNPVTNVVVGDRIYVLRLRNGSFKKIIIDQLQGTTYTFRYADLDGQNEATATINKSDFADNTLAYFNLTTQAAVADVEPAGGFDFLFCRYLAPIYDPGSDTFLEYPVTGIVSGLGVQVAKADGVDPATVSYTDYADSLSARLDIVGHDWKSFSGTAWSLDEDRVYFAKTADEHIWKLYFIDFEGSSTGKAVFEKTDLGLISGTGDVNQPDIQTIVYPNPTTDQVYVVMDFSKTGVMPGQIEVYDFNGRTVAQQKVQTQETFQAIELSASTWTPGLYQICWVSGNQKIFLKTMNRI